MKCLCLCRGDGEGERARKVVMNSGELLPHVVITKPYPAASQFSKLLLAPEHHSLAFYRSRNSFSSI